MSRPKIRIERDLYRPLLLGAAKEGWLLYHPSDYAGGRRPADLIGLTSYGTGVIVEVKRHRVGMLRRDEDFPMQLLDVHQVGWLQGYASRSGCALVALWGDQDQRLGLYRFRDPLKLQLGFRLIDGGALQRELLWDAEGRLVGWEGVNTEAQLVASFLQESRRQGWPPNPGTN